MVYDTRLHQTRMPFLRQDIPAPSVFVFILRNVLRWSLQRKMRCGERKVVEKGFFRVKPCVLLQRPHRVLRDGGCRIVLPRLRGGDAVLLVGSGLEVITLGLASDFKRADKSVCERLSVNVPLAGMVGAVARLVEKLCCQRRPDGPDSLPSPCKARYRIPAHLLCVITGQERRARRPAACGVVELGEAQPVGSECIHIWRVYLATVTAQIRKP